MTRFLSEFAVSREWKWRMVEYKKATNAATRMVVARRLMALADTMSKQQGMLFDED